MSMRYDDPEEAKGIKIYGKDAVEIKSDSEVLDEWFQGFHGSNPDQIEILSPIQATGTEFAEET